MSAGPDRGILRGRDRRGELRPLHLGHTDAFGVRRGCEQPCGLLGSLVTRDA